MGLRGSWKGIIIKNMYYLYILRCSDKTLYTGITVDIERRIDEHNHSNLGAKYTKARRPVRLIYSKKYRNRSAASKAEARMKKMSRKKKQELIRRSHGIKKKYDVSI